MKSTLLKSFALSMCLVSMGTFAIVGGKPDCEPMFGTPDQCGHPYVGAISFQSLSNGAMYPSPCTATLIHLGETAVAITAAHCAYLLEGVYKIRFTLDSRAFERTAGLPYNSSISTIFDLSRYVDVATVATHPDYIATQLAGKDNFLKTEHSDMALLLIDAENTTKLKAMWPSVTPATLPVDNLLDDIGHKALKNALVQVGYGLNEVVSNDSSSPAKTSRLTTSGERRIGDVNYRTHTPKGTIFRGENATLLDTYDGASSGDSGSPLLYGDTIVGVHKGGIPSVHGVGPRVDHQKALDFICTYVPDSTPPCGDRD